MVTATKIAPKDTSFSLELEDSILKDIELITEEEKEEENLSKSLSIFDPDSIEAHIQPDLDASRALWKDSPYRGLTELSSDKRGQHGEEFSISLFTDCGIPFYYEGNANVNQEDGKYDIKICSDWLAWKANVEPLFASGKGRVEIKTSVSHKNWQHEPIYKETVWDFILFFDISPDRVVITLMTHAELSPVFDKVKVLNKTATLRKAKLDGYKFDFSLATFKLAIQQGYAIEIPNGDLMRVKDRVLNFIKTRLRGTNDPSIRQSV